jgi:hypothetical protein
VPVHPNATVHALHRLRDVGAGHDDGRVLAAHLDDARLRVSLRELP